MSTVHVIGAGVSGLSAAVNLAARGRRVQLYEAAPHAGGRCRSFFDAELERTIDNGGHLVLGANPSVFAYLDTIGGRAALQEIAPATFPFLELHSGETWRIRPNAGPVPWWILAPSRRVPGAPLAEYLGLRRALAAGPDAVVGDFFAPTSALFIRLIEPLTTAVMNAAPGDAAAQPMMRVLRETILRGEAACRPFIARHGLSAAFVDPALRYLDGRGAQIRFGTRLHAIRFEANRAVGLDFTSHSVPVEAGSSVIVAVPPTVAAALLPDLPHPPGASAIVNAHFRLDTRARLPGGLPLLGLIGGTAQWLIARDDVVSVTVSAAGALAEQPAEELLAALWRDTARALGSPGRAMPPGRLIKERRATFAQTPAAERLRPPARTRWSNLHLAGDWTATGLPATIEGSIRSGVTASALAMPS